MSDFKISIRSVLVLLTMVLFVCCQKDSEEVSSDFTVSSRNPFAGEIVTFENLSERAETYVWDFGDGISSTEVNPQHAYENDGFYTIALESSNSLSSDVRVKERYVQVLKRDFPIVDFTTSNVIATIGESINFLNLSEFGEEYVWDFGDLTTSEQINPIHSYSDEGYYSVSLIAFNVHGSHELSKECMIQVKASVDDYTFPEGTIPCKSACETTEINEILNPITNRIWMDRNIGAARVAESTSDELAYGDLYQWGRFSDGHQCRNSSTTSLRSNSPTPWHGEFIEGSGNWLQVAISV